MIRVTILGIPVEFKPSFFLLLGGVLVFSDGIFVCSSLVFSLLHEFAHGGAAFLLHYHPEKIKAGVFGGVLQLKESIVAPGAQLWIHMAGPAFNILCALLFFEVYCFYPQNWLLELILTNIILGIFNLLPFYPLDGGKLIRLYLSFFLGYGRADRISEIFSRLFAVFLFLFGIYLVQYNVINLLICALAVNLAIVSKEDNSFVFYKLIRRIETDDAPRSRILVCKTDTPVWKVLQTFRPRERRTLTVVNHKGNYKGQLNDEELLSGLYACGFQADFHKVLDWKKSKKQKNGE